IFKKENYLLEYSIEDDIQITMDKDRLKQIIYNLLSNSMKYLDKGGKVLVGLGKIGSDVRITVEDNGIGIKKEDLPFVFERFYRSDISRNKETGGTGLGLSIVKALVEAHESSISVDSIVDKG